MWGSRCVVSSADVVPFAWHLEPLPRLLSLRHHFLPPSSCVLRYYHSLPRLLNRIISGIYIEVKRAWDLQESRASICRKSSMMAVACWRVVVVTRMEMRGGGQVILMQNKLVKSQGLETWHAWHVSGPFVVVFVGGGSRGGCVIWSGNNTNWK